MSVSKEQDPKKIPHKKISHGKAIQRRREMADERRNVFILNQRITERIQAARRLAEIKMLLSPDNGTLSLMNDFDRERTRAELGIEQIWLQRKYRLITSEQQEQLLSSKLDELERKLPDVYKLLIRNDHGPSIAQQIRDKVMPPIRVAGFYTKR